MRHLSRFAAFAGILIAGLTLSATSAANSVVVGGKNFTEQLLVSEMTVQLLAANGFSPEKRAGLGSAVLRQAQENGQIDVYWEYTGTSLITYNRIEEPMSAEETYETVKRLDGEKGLVWLEPSMANNTYAFAMRRAHAQEHGISSLSDLAAAMNDGAGLSLASNAEFYARSDGLTPLQEAYGFQFPRRDIKRMDSGLTYQALRESQVEVALVFATDGRIPAFDFIVLEDDQGFFPNYALTPVIRDDVLQKNPGLADLLNSLSAVLNDDTMAELNARVDVERQSIEKVSEDFLKSQGLI